MEQEITIIVMVDTVGAVRAGRLDGNIYLIDNLRSRGSTGVGTGELTTIVYGTYWSNGSQASEPLFNWLIGSISSLPPSLPRNYQENRSREAERLELEDIRSVLEASSLKSTRTKLRAMAHGVGQSIRLKTNRGTTKDVGLKLLDVRGEVVQRGQEAKTSLAQPPPVITNLTGEAVDEGILYPAQYGTPINIKDGWYWSATASTFRPGLYRYTLHITVYELVWSDGGDPVWVPRAMSHDAKIRLTTEPMTNGFTGGGTGPLPISP